MAREGCWDGTFSLPPPPLSSPFTHTPLVLFSPSPPRPPGNKAHCFSPRVRLRVTTRSPYLLRVRVPEAGRGERKGRGTGGLASVLGELSATDHRPVALISFLALFRLTIFLISSYTASHAPDRRAFVTGIPSPQEGFEPHELSGPVQCMLGFWSLYS